MSSLPKQFIDSLAKILNSDEIQDFISALNQSPAPTSIRFNPYKISHKPELINVPWSRYGFYINKDQSFTLDPSFHAGAYYVQEASSMFIEHIYNQCFTQDDSPVVLDLCASPGGKTTLLSSLVGLEGLIHANEVIRTRSLTLADNVSKWGLANVVVTNNDPSHFDSTKEFYDLILVDAPCSGEGMFRKDPSAREQWSESSVELCASRQKRILSEIWSSLKPGGVMIYSTCTFNRQENEENIEWLAEQYDTEPIDIDVPSEWNIVKSEASGINCFRFYPSRVRGEGFFCAAIRKGDAKLRTKLSKPRRTPFSELNNKSKSELAQWLNQPDLMHTTMAGDKIYAYYQASFQSLKQICERYSVVYSGVEMGQFFGKKFKPEHPLALFHDLNTDNINTCELTIEQAQEYLRKNDIQADLFCEGLNAVSYNNLTFGWAKRISNRVNNLYPKNLRILNL